MTAGNFAQRLGLCKADAKPVSKAAHTFLV
jgi:hypothetical protein